MSSFDRLKSKFFRTKISALMCMICARIFSRLQNQKEEICVVFEVFIDMLKIVHIVCSHLQYEQFSDTCIWSADHTLLHNVIYKSEHKNIRL